MDSSTGTERLAGEGRVPRATVASSTTASRNSLTTGDSATATGSAGEGAGAGGAIRKDCTAAVKSTTKLLSCCISARKTLTSLVWLCDELGAALVAGSTATAKGERLRSPVCMPEGTGGSTEKTLFGELGAA